MSLDRIQGLLNTTMGLDISTIGAGSLDRAVKQRMQAARLEDVDTYWERLQSSAVELQSLIDTISVPETWFFRDRGAFVALGRIALEAMIRTRSSATLRVLSVPCATGEEAYSISMCLLDAGIPPHRFQIDALDISQRAIESATTATYGRNSFRGEGLDFRDRYFERTPAGWRVRDTVRRQVRLRTGNVLACAGELAQSAFDVIFCRNLLIYLDRASQSRAIKALDTLLAPEGTLFIGPSESGLLLENGFVSARMPMSFAFRRATVAKATVPAAAALPRAPRVTTPHARRTRRAAPSAEPVNPPPQQPSPMAPLERVQRLADAGNLAEAMQCCKSYLRADATSVQGTYLMGLLHDAAGESAQAREQYRRAVYLDPTHHEALVHLAVILAREGDERAAQQLFARARRAATSRRSGSA